jgi:hypothetical protein
MTHDILTNEYIEWMCNLICYNPRVETRTYQQLLRHLHNREFTYILDMDYNRAADGIDLRYRFADEKGYGYRYILKKFEDEPCSVLEMIVALANRCEESIMDDPDIGNRTGLWFWNMISSLGLDDMDDLYYDEQYTDEVIDRFLNREYAPNGEGGLFTVNRSDDDLRDVEIWYQMCWYLAEI